jgi:pectinesterase
MNLPQLLKRREERINKIQFLMKIRYSLFTFLSLMISLTPGILFSQEKYDITVSKDGTGDYSNIQSAVDACKAFPDQRIIIHIRNGVYNEKVVVPACNNKISIIGESVDKTIISYGDYFGKVNRGRNSTFYTYTFLVEADDFFAENLTFENSAGPVGQAVALHVEGNRCAFRNCRILGNQDTLYTGGTDNHQYFKACYIQGTTDFIFGSATVVFDSCVIFSKADSYITASSTIKGKSYGYVFMNCRLTSDEGVNKVYLGRPWRDYAKVVFINCEMGKHILPEGWSDWPGTERFKTAFFAEFGNTGAGSKVSERVSWSHQLSKKMAAKYTIKNILSPELPLEMPVDQWITGNNQE